MRELLKRLKRMLQRNRKLFALDIAGNHLFDNYPHSFNEHLSNYLEDLSQILCESRITHLDISNNNVIGTSGRQYKGLATLTKHYILHRAKAFTCRLNNLHSHAFAIIADGLGTLSSLTYLDLSDNFGGLGSVNEPNSSGIATLCAHMTRCPKLRTLKLARNCLGDDCFEIVANAVSFLSHMQFLDMAGNNCHATGMEALRHAIVGMVPVSNDL